MSKPETTLRLCACGCGLSFRSLRPAFFYSRSHAEICKNRKDDIGVEARKYLKAATSNRITTSPRVIMRKRLAIYYPESDLDDLVTNENADADNT